MDIKQETEARESHRKILGKRLLDGEKLTDLVDENPALIFEFQKLEANLAAYKRAKHQNKPDCPDHIPNTWDLCLPKMPEEKKRHYWFWSKAYNKGKSKFLLNMEKNYRAEFLAKEEKYQDFPADTEFILIDEFSEPFLKTT